jgi:hypothetical protein
VLLFKQKVIAHMSHAGWKVASMKQKRGARKQRDTLGEMTKYVNITDPPQARKDMNFSASSAKERGGDVHNQRPSVSVDFFLSGQ